MATLPALRAGSLPVSADQKRLPKKWREWPLGGYPTVTGRSQSKKELLLKEAAGAPKGGRLASFKAAGAPKGGRLASFAAAGSPEGGRLASFGAAGAPKGGRLAISVATLPALRAGSLPVSADQKRLPKKGREWPLGGYPTAEASQ